MTKGASRSKVPDEIIKSLDGDHQRAHTMVLERADKHIAHRVGDEEQGRVFLVLSNPRLEPAVVGTGYFFIRFVGPDSNEVLLAAETANVIANSIAETVESVQSLVVESAKQQDLDSLYAKAGPLGDEPAD